MYYNLLKLGVKHNLSTITPDCKGLGAKQPRLQPRPS